MTYVVDYLSCSGGYLNHDTEWEIMLAISRFCEIDSSNMNSYGMDLTPQSIDNPLGRSVKDLSQELVHYLIGGLGARKVLILHDFGSYIGREALLQLDKNSIIERDITVLNFGGTCLIEKDLGARVINYCSVGDSIAKVRGKLLKDKLTSLNQEVTFHTWESLPSPPPPSLEVQWLSDQQDRRFCDGYFPNQPDSPEILHHLARYVQPLIDKLGSLDLDQSDGNIYLGTCCLGTCCFGFFKCTQYLWGG